MAESTRPGRTEPPEIIYIEDHHVACDGGGGALGHPLVYLTLGDREMVQCGYCDRTFVLRQGVQPTSAH